MSLLLLFRPSEFVSPAVFGECRAFNEQPYIVHVSDERPYHAGASDERPYTVTILDEVG